MLFRSHVGVGVNQIRPSFFFCLRNASDMPDMVPIAIEWSPPSTRGVLPLSYVLRTICASREQASAISTILLIVTLVIFAAYRRLDRKASA